MSTPAAPITTFQAALQTIQRGVNTTTRDDFGGGFTEAPGTVGSPISSPIGGPVTNIPVSGGTSGGLTPGGVAQSSLCLAAGPLSFLIPGCASAVSATVSGNTGTINWLSILFIVLGIVAIIGAIYLYKPTQEIVAAPVRAVRDTIGAAAVA